MQTLQEIDAEDAYDSDIPTLRSSFCAWKDFPKVYFITIL